MIVPSRGRPQNIAGLVRCWQETTTDAHLMVAVDNDDPALSGYLDLELPALEPLVTLAVGPRRRMVGTLNHLAVPAAGNYFALGFMGDDHRPRTPGWDSELVKALREMGTGIVYGDDLFQGERLPTAAVMTSDIVRVLGYMVPPSLTHLYVDNTWKAWGEGVGRLRYLPDVVLEHAHPLHPRGAKAAWDPGYAEVNDPSMYARDGAAFQRYVATELDRDLKAMRALL